MSEQRSRILLVEDDYDARVLVEHVLLTAGHQVDATDSVEGGRDRLHRQRYDLLLVDGRLPDGTGMVIADNARELGVRVLIMTGYAFSLPHDDLARYEFLLKPVRPRELIQAVERVLAQPNGMTGLAR